MKSSEVIRQIQSDVTNVKALGNHHITIADLESYLTAVLQHVQASEPVCNAQAAQNEHHCEVWKARLAANTVHASEMFKSVVESGQTALRAAVGINAGAATALLAFASNAITQRQALPGGPLLSEIGQGLAYFIAGMAFAGFACGVRYLAQLTYSKCAQEQPKGRGLKALAHVLNFITIALGTVSFVVFCAGGYSTYTAIAKPSTASISPDHAKTSAAGAIASTDTTLALTCSASRKERTLFEKYF